MLFNKDNSSEIKLVSSNLQNFFKAIVDFFAAVCEFFGFDPFAAEE